MRYVTLNGNTDEVAVWKSKEDASRAVLQFDNHKIHIMGKAGEWRIWRFYKDNKTISALWESFESHHIRLEDALYKIAQGFDGHAIMNESIARHEGYLSD